MSYTRDHPQITIEAFRNWLQDAEREATPCDTGKCVLSIWLQDEGFVEPQVDGDTICETEGLVSGDRELDPLRMETPSWCNHVICTFDSMAPDSLPVGLTRFAPVQPEVYREPLLSLVDRIIANDKRFAEDSARAFADEQERSV